ncbi:hypothetical protein I7I48_03454 [Histoplasma ohiense]|nr:hypothetical protein I7I48_03454 [Histoplasma ohiense (nom. inval.)]
MLSIPTYSTCSLTQSQGPFYPEHLADLVFLSDTIAPTFANNNNTATVPDALFFWKTCSQFSVYEFGISHEGLYPLSSNT